MVAATGRYLHQPIDHVMEWPVDQFFLIFDQIKPLREAEQPQRGET